MPEIPSVSSVFEGLLGQTIEPAPADTAIALRVEVESFFEEFHDPLMRYLRSFQLEVHDAEDIIQEAFLALFRHLRAGKPRTNIKGWIFRVAHNLGLKRRQKLRQLHYAAGSGNNPDLSTGNDLNPEQQLLHNQRRRHLLAVLVALPERNRQCLSLRAEGLRYREIAEVLGVSLGTVAALLERSIRRLQEAERR